MKSEEMKNGYLKIVYPNIISKPLYDDIWDMIENTLYNDKEILHISLLGEYDYFITEKFFKETVKAVNEYLLI